MSVKYKNVVLKSSTMFLFLSLFFLFFYFFWGGATFFVAGMMCHRKKEKKEIEPAVVRNTVHSTTLTFSLQKVGKLLFTEIGAG